MNVGYDLHQHTHCIIFHFRNAMVSAGLFSTTARQGGHYIALKQMGSYITYDRQKLNILSRGDKSKDKEQIDVSEEKLYQLFQKDKSSLDQEDLFFPTAVSDFIRLFAEELLALSENKIKDINVLHYIFVVPSEWEEEIKEVLIRPIFIQANLISEDDHQDRLLFCSDVESICYLRTNPASSNSDMIVDNLILGRLVPVKEDQVLIKLDLISIRYPLFDLPNALLFPKIKKSSALSLTSNDIKNAIREVIKTKFSFQAQEETIRKIMEELSRKKFITSTDKEVSNLKKVFITNTSISKLDKCQEKSLKSIRPFDICKEISEKLSNNLRDFLPGAIVKDYSIFKFNDEYSSEIKLDKGLLNWSRYLFEYNRISFNSKYIEAKKHPDQGNNYKDVIRGARRYALEAVQNSDIYSRPRILSTENSESIFLKSKPDAIMNINLSLDSTELSFLILDENGSVKEICDHNYFVTDRRLRSLGSFFSFSEVTALTVKDWFIIFFDVFFKEDLNFASSNKYKASYKKILAIIEDILNFDTHNKDQLVSIQQQDHTRMFASIYLIYIKEIISRKLSIILGRNDNINIGYAITIEDMLLERVFGTEDDLKDVIYEIGLVQKDDSCKKLRIFRHGERLLPVIKQAFNFQIPLKHFFVVAQLYDDYVKLTLNQVVTDNEDQEAIVTQEEIISTQNIYKSLCFNVWGNIMENTSLIQLCDTHQGYNNDKLLDLFSLENQIGFAESLKEYISKNILEETSTIQKTDTANLYISTSCNCKICLTVNDIIEISFRPVLQDIVSLVSTTLINNQFFGKYRNVQYIFHLIHFNSNPHFQDILIKLLNDETAYFMYERRVDIDHYTISKLSNELLQPIVRQIPFSYKAFREGVLYHVFSDNYWFGISGVLNWCIYFKNKITDSNINLDKDGIVFPLLKKGTKISNSLTSRVFYLSTADEYGPADFGVDYFRREKTDVLMFNKTFCVKDMSETITGSSLFKYEDRIRCMDEPCVISIFYAGYASSLFLMIKYGGDEIQEKNITTILEPMTLARF